MNQGEWILILTKLVFGFFATFTSLLLWSRSRESSWLFIVMGTVFLYGEIVLSSLHLFGLAEFYLLTVYGISIFPLLFSSLPYIFFTIGFIIFLKGRKRGY